MPAPLPPKVVVFDLDDTLCGYWNAARYGLKRAFEVHSETGKTPEEMLALWGEEFGGLVKELSQPRWYSKYCQSGETTRRELMKRVLARLEIRDVQLVQDMSDTYYIERHGALELFPESIETLEALKGRFRLAMITNGPADIQRQEIETLQIGHYFDPVLIEGEMGMGKPNPEVMNRLESLTDAKGEEILMVGNSFGHDVKPAQAAGWRTVWIRRPSDVAPSSRTGKPEEMPEEATPPDFIIHDLRELYAEGGPCA